jgi:hypothetical protein
LRLAVFSAFMPLCQYGPKRYGKAVEIY